MREKGVKRESDLGKQTEWGLMGNGLKEEMGYQEMGEER